MRKDRAVVDFGPKIKHIKCRDKKKACAFFLSLSTVVLYSDERQSRKDFRKWENTKFISKKIGKNRAIKPYETGLWGISLTSKERLDSKSQHGLNFGAVITLKEINGVNRIYEFEQACIRRGWIVNSIIAQNRLELYNKNQEEIVFDE